MTTALVVVVLYITTFAFAKEPLNSFRVRVVVSKL